MNANRRQAVNVPAPGLALAGLLSIFEADPAPFGTTTVPNRQAIAAMREALEHVAALDRDNEQCDRDLKVSIAARHEAEEMLRLRDAEIARLRGELQRYDWDPEARQALANGEFPLTRRDFS